MAADKMGLCVKLHSISGDVANRPLKFTDEFLCCVKRNFVLFVFVINSNLLKKFRYTETEAGSYDERVL